MLYDNGTFKIKRVHDSNYQTISNKQYLKVSDIYELSGNNINNFENYWINCIVLTDNGNNKPKIRWWPHPNYFQYQIEGYKIYYSFHNNGFPPGTFSHLATVNNNTFDYVHQSLNLGSGDLISYYIKAIIIDEHESTFETSASNSVTAQLDILFKQSNNEKEILEFNYSLSQNHPNPFNPVTYIK